MTDERIGDALLPAIRRLPRGSGVVFRHNATPPRERRALYEAVRAAARARGLVLVLAGPPALAIAWRADGAHGPSPHRRAARPLLRTASAHDAREVAERGGAADLLFVSPVFATRSHPGARTLGRVRLARLARGARVSVVALGGMTRARWPGLRRVGANGWAAIDGLSAPLPAREGLGVGRHPRRPR